MGFPHEQFEIALRVLFALYVDDECREAVIRKNIDRLHRPARTAPEGWPKGRRPTKIQREAWPPNYRDPTNRYGALFMWLNHELEPSGPWPAIDELRAVYRDGESIFEYFAARRRKPDPIIPKKPAGRPRGAVRRKVENAT